MFAALIGAAFSVEGQSTFITGVAGEFNGSIWTGGGYDGYTLNAHRKIQDVHCVGAVTKEPLTFTRYMVTRKTLPGFGSTIWSYNWEWVLKQESNQWELDAPSGEAFVFPNSSLNNGWYFSKGATGLQMTINGALPVVYLKDGDALSFGLSQADIDNPGVTDYLLTLWTDRYGQSLTLTSGTLGSTPILTVSEPGGRWIQISNPSKVTQVSTSDGQLVTYTYNTWTLGSKSVSELQTVTYNDGTTTQYSYVADPTRTMLVPKKLLDLRFGGPVASILYTYQTISSAGSPSAGEIQSESDSNGNLLSKIADIGNPGGIVSGATVGRTETTGDGNSRKLFYDTLGHLIQETDFNGNSTGYGWDSNTGYLDSVTDANNFKTQYQREERLGRIDAIIYPDGSSVSWTFTSATFPYYVWKRTDENGYTTIYNRDPNNRIQSIQYPDGGSESFTYNSFGEVLTHQTRSGGIYQYQYNPAGQLTQKTDPQGLTFTYQYDVRSRVSYKTEVGRQLTTAYTYTDRNRVQQITYPDGSTLIKQYDQNTGDLKTLTDEDGAVWQWDYDEYHRKTSETDPVLNVTQYSYPSGLNTTFDGDKLVTTQDNNEIKYTYDANRRLQSKIVGYGSSIASTTTYKYDPVGNLQTVTDPLGEVTTYTWTPRRWKASVTDPLGNTTNYGYDLHGNLNKVVAPYGDTTLHWYDPVNRLLKTEDPKGNFTVLIRNFDGTVKQRTDPDSNLYGWQYDKMGRVVEADYPDSTKESWQYYVYGPVETFTNRNGDSATFSYNARNRLLQKAWTTGLSTTYTVDAAGYRTSISNYSAYDQIKYYANHKVQYDIQEVEEGAWVNNHCSLFYEYNGDNLVEEMQVSEGSGIEATLTYKYNARNQLSTEDATGLLLPNSIEADYSYDLRGDRKEKDLSTGAYTTYAYDDDGQIKNIIDYEAKDNDAVLQSNYTVDNKGRIQSIQHTQTGATLQFGYDSDDNLTGYINPGGSSTENSGLAPLVGVEPPATTNDYQIDAADNWTQLTINGASTAFVPNNLNQYASIGSLIPTYDNNGNLTSYNGWTFTYDAENHLRVVSGATTTIKYDYDGLGRCVVQTVNGVARFNVYDHWNPVMAIDTSGNIVVQNVYGLGTDELICSSHAGVSSPYFYHQDHRGSVTGISDSNGIMQETVMYDPYGQPYMFNRAGQSLSQSQFNNTFYFAGRPYTPLLGWKSGIYDMRHRFYAADIGRFMQVDPSGFKGGGNLYAYSGDSPIDRTDPEGLEFGIPANGSQAAALLNSNGNYSDGEPLGSFIEAGAIFDAGAMAALGVGAGGAGVAALTVDDLVGYGLSAGVALEGFFAGVNSGLGWSQWGNASMSPGGYVGPGVSYLSGGQWPYSAPPVGFSQAPPTIPTLINDLINAYNQAVQLNSQMQMQSDPNSTLNQQQQGGDTTSQQPIDGSSSTDFSQGDYAGMDYGGTDLESASLAWVDITPVDASGFTSNSGADPTMGGAPPTEYWGNMQR